MSEDEILDEFITELDCEDQGLEFREFCRSTIAFKRYKLTKDWANVREDLIDELVKKMG